MDIIYEIKVNLSFEEAINSIKNNLKEHDFGVLWELNFKEKLKEKGFDTDVKFKILEVCNPKKAKEVLETTIKIGYLLPCKIAIYEKDNSIFVGMMKPTSLIKFLNNEDLNDVANEIENELKQVINEIKK